MADAQAECPPIVLAFAASDPSGGAGLQADILTLASMGCHPLSVVTALTVQDTAGVENIFAIDMKDWGLEDIQGEYRGRQLRKQAKTIAEAGSQPSASRRAGR